LQASPPPAQRAASVARLVGGNAHEPWAERTRLIKPSERTESAQERLLGSVLRLGGVSENEIGEAEGGLLMEADKVLPRRRVALPGASDTLWIRQWGLSGEDFPTVLHRGSAARSRLMVKGSRRQLWRTEPGKADGFMGRDEGPWPPEEN
jgi:hypothetical protein